MTANNTPTTASRVYLLMHSIKVFANCTKKEYKAITVLECTQSKKWAEKEFHSTDKCWL